MPRSRWSLTPSGCPHDDLHAPRQSVQLGNANPALRIPAGCGRSGCVAPGFRTPRTPAAPARGPVPTRGPGAATSCPGSSCCKDRQSEGSCFTGPRLREADDVAALQQCGIVSAWIGDGVSYPGLSAPAGSERPAPVRRSLGSTGLESVGCLYQAHRVQALAKRSCLNPMYLHPCPGLAWRTPQFEGCSRAHARPRVATQLAKFVTQIKVPELSAATPTPNLVYVRFRMLALWPAEFISPLRPPPVSCSPCRCSRPVPHARAQRPDRREVAVREGLGGGEVLGPRLSNLGREAGVELQRRDTSRLALRIHECQDLRHPR